jgi:hypothetical protein
LNYELKNYQVLNFVVIPKHFFRTDIIEKRKPLSEEHKRKIGEKSKNRK